MFKCSFDEFFGGESCLLVLFLHHLITASYFPTLITKYYLGTVGVGSFQMPSRVLSIWSPEVGIGSSSL